MTIIEKVRAGELDPKTALHQVRSHGTLLKDVVLNLNKRSLKCGLKAIEEYEYIIEGAGNLIVLAARPGNGKTALACQIGLNSSKNTRVLLFSLEMNKAALKERLVSVVSGVPIKKLRQSVFAPRIVDAEKELENCDFTVIDDGDQSVTDIISKTYDENRNKGIGLVIIDYIGNIKVNNESRALSIGEAAKRLKRELADKLKIPVLVLAQMNRGFDNRFHDYQLAKEKSKFFKKTDDVSSDFEPEFRPSMSDLGESSGIEHAADVVMFLHRPYTLDKRADPSDFKVFVAKNRNGEVADFELQFSQELTKFYDKEDNEI